MFKHILLATDGSALSGKGAETAIRVAKALGARITAVHVVRAYDERMGYDGLVMPKMPELKKRFEANMAAAAKSILNPVKQAADEGKVTCETVMAAGENPYEKIIEQAKRSKCDLIIMASHGRKGIQSVLLGSETTKVLTHSDIPVLVVR
ncbi:MAG: universal stress protein [Betaproteobacteria bacterium]|nr:universal stress protein [Betaproteobacteria bacterium]